MDVFICSLGQTKGACRVVFVFQMGKTPAAEHKMGVLRGGKIPAVEWETPSGRNPTTEGFDSCKTIEKSPYACLRYRLRVGKIPAAERTVTSLRGGNSSSEEVLLPPPREGNPICEVYRWMYVCCRAILLLPPSGLSPFFGLVNDCMLWSCLPVGCLHLRGERTVVCCATISLLSPSGLSPSSRPQDGCVLWI